MPGQTRHVQRRQGRERTHKSLYRGHIHTAPSFRTRKTVFIKGLQANSEEGNTADEREYSSFPVAK